MSEKQESPKVTPQSLVTEDLLRAALRADKGDDAEMLSWEVKDFTKKGDNYACVVTSGVVHFRQGDDHEEKQVTYVAKCNPCRFQEGMEDFTKHMFMKEANFYTKIVPLINAELKAVGQEPLRLATCYLTHLVEGEQIILLKDLRADGFRMFDRKKGMDVDHVTLVLRELARLHAASTLVQDKASDPLEVTYDFLGRDFDSFESTSGDKIFSGIMSSSMQNGANMVKKIDGYDKVVDWMQQHSSQAYDMFVGTLKKSPPFDMVCHGDCWNNNILFKYDKAGRPVDVRLLDLQICRKASPATDLNYLMYTSLNGSVRKENLQTFLKTYYESFGKILAAAGKTMAFTLDELKEEYHRLNLFGLLMALMVVPLVVTEKPDLLDFDDMTGDMDADMKAYEEKMLEQMNNNPLLRPRLLSTYDDMIEYGVIS